MKKSLPIFASLLLLTACAAPKQFTVVDSKLVNKSFDQTWQNQIKFFAENNISIKTIAKDSGIIYAEAMTFDDNLADCGSYGLYRPIDKKFSLNVFTAPANDKQTSVKINTSFEVTLQYGNLINKQKCNSTGYIERLMLGSL